MDPQLALKIAFFGHLMVALTLHEFGHAWVAWRCGDSSVRRAGRVSLNPIRHLDLLYSVLLPLVMLFSNVGALFGAGKPVAVDVSRLRHPRRHMFWISAAGPAMNVLLAFVWTAALHAVVRADIDPRSFTGDVLWNGIKLNLVLAVFNLLPIPPLDGHRILGFFLPASWADRYERLWWLGPAVFVALFAAGGFTLKYLIEVLRWLERNILRPLGTAWDPLLPEGVFRVF